MTGSRPLLRPRSPVLVLIFVLYFCSFDSSISALLCNAAPPENLVHVWDPAMRTHRLLFDMTPIYVEGRTLLDLLCWHLPPIWHDVFIWIHCASDVRRLGNVGGDEHEVGDAAKR